MAVRHCLSWHEEFQTRFQNCFLVWNWMIQPLDWPQKLVRIVELECPAMNEETQ